jgi:N utilization substance protein A
LTGWRVDIRSETEFAKEEAEMGYEEEEVAGRCAAIMSNGRRCPNAALPGSRYCGLPAHQALEGTGTDYVGGAPPEEQAAETAAPEEETPAEEPAEGAPVPAAEGDTAVEQAEAAVEEAEPSAVEAEPVSEGVSEQAEDAVPEEEPAPAAEERETAEDRAS